MAFALKKKKNKTRSSKPQRKINDTWFKKKLQEQGITQAEAAERMGLHKSSISHVFMGLRRLPLEEIQKWSEILEVPVSEDMRNAGYENPEAFVSEPVLGPSEELPISFYVNDQFEVLPDANLRKHWVPNYTGKTDVSTALVKIPVGPISQLDGCIFYFKNKFSEVEADCLGRFSLVFIKDEKTPKIRTVNRGYVAGHYNLILPFSDEVKEEDALLEKATPILHLKL